MIKWSYSSLKKFLTCPKQYHEIKVKKTFKEPDTQATLYGKEVHKAFEEYMKNGILLPDNYAVYQKYLDALQKITGQRYTELKMGLTHEKKACHFDDPDYWVHGITDLLIIDGDMGYVIDYKTGSDKYLDMQQLKLMALMIFEHFPVLNHIKVALLFITRSRFESEEYSRSDIGSLWVSFQNDLKRLEHSYENDFWPENPSGLCFRHCVVTTCPHNGRSK